MRRVFIANRGAIAVRIVGACRALDLECVVGASEPDMSAMAAHLADRSVCLGPGPPADSYLRPEIVVRAAREAECDAIHPGDGLLADDPRLAELAAEAGIAFVGPPAEALARRRRAGAPPGGGDVRRTPVPPGGGDVRRSPGPPGGGGVLRSPVAPGAGGVRRIAVPLAVDHSGAIVHLGERDCSLCRGGEIVVAESPPPPPALDAAIRARIRASATARAREIGHRNLGAAVFAVGDGGGQPRLVDFICHIDAEHALTEAATGLDLVAMQLAIAAGDPLEITDSDVAPTLHAVGARLRAQDATRGFQPSTGTLSLFSVPERAGLRVDTDCRPGTEVVPYYDTPLATLVAAAPERQQALDILIDALEDLDVEGVETNRTLLIAVLGHPDLRAGAVSAQWLQRLIG